MFKKTTFAAALLAATVMSGVASAKTFVYCSEASPEGFDPGLYTAGTTFDASAHPVYNRLLEFKHGHDRDRARPRRKLGGFRRRPGIHLQAASGRQVPDHRVLHADARFQRRRRGLLLRAPAARPTIPGTSMSPAPPGNISPAWAFPTCIDSDREGRRPDGEVHAEAHRKRRSSPTSAMDFASIMSKEYADKLRGRRQDGAAEPACRSAPARSRSSPTSRMRSSATRRNAGLLGRQAEDRRPRLRHHHRRRGALPEAEGRRMPPHAVSERGRRRGA